MFITIRDLNDNKPTFQTEGFTYITSIPENTQVGTAIFFQMGAIDKDREVICCCSVTLIDIHWMNNNGLILVVFSKTKLNLLNFSFRQKMLNFNIQYLVILTMCFPLIQTLEE